MIRTAAFPRGAAENSAEWYWIDFSDPVEEEIKQLTDHFGFHPLAVEDCLDQYIQRPKLDFYEDYEFLVIHAFEKETLKTIEIDIFAGRRFIITFHTDPVAEIDEIWKRIEDGAMEVKGPFFLLHGIIDKAVDEYFPLLYRMENELNDIEDNTGQRPSSFLLDRLFDVRGELSVLRKSILPMRDLLYRMIHSERLSYLQEQHLYFHDVHDHLLKLAEMLDSQRDLSSDIRDSYLSVNSNNMNETMMALTVITTIFMPLTFIAGVYGMNFRNMPELDWHYGYYAVLAVMALTAAGMSAYFIKKKWLGTRWTSMRRRKIEQRYPQRRG